MARDVYNQIARTIGIMRAEQRGAIGWREDERVIRYFRFNEAVPTIGATYAADDRLFNATVMRDWSPRGVRLAGFVRSRPIDLVWPSSDDLGDSKHILATIAALPYLVLLIAQTMPDTGRFGLVPSIVKRSGEEVVSGLAELEVLDGVVTVPGETFRRHR